MALSFSVFNKFKAIDDVTAPVRKMTRSVGKFGDEAVAAFKRADQASSRFGKKMSGVGREMSTKMTLPLTLLGGMAAKTAIDFESAWTGVTKTVSATTDEFDVLKKGLMDMALRIPITTEEIFGIAEAAGQLGIQQKDIIGFTEVMANLGATTNITAAEAAMALAKFANITGMAGEDIERLGSTIVDLGNNTATTEADIVAMGMRLAGAGKTIGLTQAQIMSLAASLSSVGLGAEAGGTAFSMIMKKIGKEVGSGSKLMDKFAMVAGKSTTEFERAWREDAGMAMIDIIEGLGNLQKEGKNVNSILDNMGFTGIRISDSLLRASGAGDTFRKTMALGNKAWEENNALSKEAELRYATAASQLTIAWTKVKQMAVTFGAILVPAIIAVINFLEPVVNWLKELSPTAKTVIIVIAALAAGIGPLVVVLGVLITSFTAIAAIGAPVIATISAIVFAFGGISAAIITVIKNWTALKSEIALGIKFIIDKFKALTGGVIGKVASFFGFGAPAEVQVPEPKVAEVQVPEPKVAAQQETPIISPNAGLANTIRQETTNKSNVSVDFSNIPKGTEVKQDGDTPPGFDLNLGYAGA